MSDNMKHIKNTVRISEKKRGMTMKLLLRIVGGVLYLVLLLLRPIFMIISIASSKIFTIVGVIIIVLALLTLGSEGISGNSQLPLLILTLIVGSILMLVAPFIEKLDEWYEVLHVRLGDFVFNRVKNEDEILL